jgi:hypothetical protein
MPPRRALNYVIPTEPQNMSSHRAPKYVILTERSDEGSPCQFMRSLTVFNMAMLIILPKLIDAPSHILQRSQGGLLRSIRARLWICHFQIKRALCLSKASCANAENDNAMGPIEMGHPCLAQSITRIP